jgi:glycerol-3-phosphate cytidylyltransferase
MSKLNAKRIGITCSSFDLFHAGHVVMLEEAKRQCDYLIAAIQSDPTIDRETKNKPVQKTNRTGGFGSTGVA